MSHTNFCHQGVMESALGHALSESQYTAIEAAGPQLLMALAKLLTQAPQTLHSEAGTEARKLFEQLTGRRAPLPQGVDAVSPVFVPIGADSECTPESVLHGQLVMHGTYCHVTAIQVVPAGDGLLKAVAQAYAEDLEHLYDLSGSSLSTTTINGLEYVVFVIPHAA